MGELRWKAAGMKKNNVEYYILLGEPKEIMKGYSRITGTSPMLPKWAQGFSNFEWGINEQEMMEMIDTYRAKKTFPWTAMLLTMTGSFTDRIIMVNLSGIQGIFPLPEAVP